MHLNKRTFQFYDKQKESCDHAITFPVSKYGVGVRKQTDGTFRLAWDPYYLGGLEKIMGRDCGLFTQAYGIEAAKRAARIKGYGVRETKCDDGYVEMELLVR